MSWRALADALGFTAHHATEGFLVRASFRQHLHALGAIAPSVSSLHWLSGRRAGRRALLVCHRTPGEDAIWMTTAVVELGRPLLLGATIEAESGLASLFATRDLQVGVLGIDQALHLKAGDPVGLKELLTAGRDHLNFLGELCRYVERGCAVNDSAVRCSRLGERDDPTIVAGMFDDCVALAELLESRRAALPMTPREQAVQQVWREVAAARRLTFDEARMSLHGVLHKVDVELALDTKMLNLETVVEVRFPSSLGLDLTLRSAGSRGFLAQWFAGDLRLGHAAFDAAFIIRGDPEAHLKQLFASDALRTALLEAARDATELSMTQDGLFWTWPRIPLERAELDRHLDAVAAISRAIFGIGATAGPYR